jgi:ribosomal protein S18 acetylase RimI-like enzyme
MTESDLEARGDEPGVVSFTATTDDCPIAGHVDVVDEDGSHFRLARIAIAPALRGRRLAVPLVEAAVAEARSRGARSVALHVVPGNEPALRAYSRVGFRAGDPNPEHPDYIRMVLVLEPASG